MAQLKNKIKDVLPDELTVLAKTTGWSQENQNALVGALRSGDPTAVYEAWTKGSPQDTAGAEMVARQVEVKRVLARLDQDVQNKVAAGQDVADLDKSLSKLALASPVASDISKTIDTLKTWVEVRRLVAAAIPDSGAIAKLPTGKVALIRDPNMPIGKAIVLSDGAVLVGNHRRGPISIASGNAAEALGMPVVTSTPIPDAQGTQSRAGVLLVNPKDSGGNLKYGLNGNYYMMEPGMSQRLPSGRWLIEYDRGGTYGPAAFDLTDGTYYFTPTPDKGWQVYKQRFDIVLDNSENPHEFNYVLKGEKLVVPANGTRTAGDIYPIVMQFDRGNGTVATKAFNFSGTVQIGVNAIDNLWDVFPAEGGKREPTKALLFTK